MEAKDYVHEGLVEKGVDVEKTQKSEQKVEKGFSTMFPALWSYDNAPAVDESYEIPAPLDLLTSKPSPLDGHCTSGKPAPLDGPCTSGKPTPLSSGG